MDAADYSDVGASQQRDQVPAVTVAIHPMATKEPLIRIQLHVLESPTPRDEHPSVLSPCDAAESDQRLLHTPAHAVQTAADVAPMAAKTPTMQKTPAPNKADSEVESKDTSGSGAGQAEDQLASKRRLSAGAPCFRPQQQPHAAHANSSSTPTSNGSCSEPNTPSGPQRRPSFSQLLVTAPAFVPSSHRQYQQPDLQDRSQDTKQHDQTPVLHQKAESVPDIPPKPSTCLSIGAAAYIPAVVQPTKQTSHAALHEVHHSSALIPAVRNSQPMLPAAQSTLSSTVQPMYLQGTVARAASNSNTGVSMYPAAGSLVSMQSLPAAAVAGHPAAYRSLDSMSATITSKAAGSDTARWLPKPTTSTSPLPHVTTAMGSGVVVVAPTAAATAASDHVAVSLNTLGKFRRPLQIKPPRSRSATPTSTPPTTPSAAAVAVATTTDRFCSAGSVTPHLQAALPTTLPRIKRPLAIKAPASKPLVSSAEDTRPELTASTVQNITITAADASSSTAGAASQVAAPLKSTAPEGDTTQAPPEASVRQPAVPAAAQPAANEPGAAGVPTAASAVQYALELASTQPAIEESTEHQQPSSTPPYLTVVQHSAPPAALHWLSRPQPLRSENTMEGRAEGETSLLSDTSDSLAATTTSEPVASLSITAAGGAAAAAAATTPPEQATAAVAEVAPAQGAPVSGLQHAATAPGSMQASGGNQGVAGTSAVTADTHPIPSSPTAVLTAVGTASFASAVSHLNRTRSLKQVLSPGRLPPAAAAALQAAVPAGLLPANWQQYSSWGDLELHVSFTAGGVDVAALLENRKRYREAKVLAQSIAAVESARVDDASEEPVDRSSCSPTVEHAAEATAQAGTDCPVSIDASQEKSAESTAPVVEAAPARAVQSTPTNKTWDVVEAADKQPVSLSIQEAAAQPQADLAPASDVQQDDQSSCLVASAITTAEPLQPADVEADQPTLAADGPTSSTSSPADADKDVGQQAPAADSDTPGSDRWKSALKQLLSRQGFSSKAADVKWRFILPVSEDRVGPFTSDQAVSWLLQGKSPKGINRQQAAEAAEQPAAIRMCGIVSSDYNAQRLPGAKFFKPLSQLVPAVAAGLRYAAVTKADIAKGYPAAEWNTLSAAATNSSITSSASNSTQSTTAAKQYAKAKNRHRNTGRAEVSVMMNSDQGGSSTAASMSAPSAGDSSDACDSWEADFVPLLPPVAPHNTATATTASTSAAGPPTPATTTTAHTAEVVMHLVDVSQLSAEEVQSRFSSVLDAMLASHKHFLESLSEKALQMLALVEPSDLQEVLLRPDAEQQLLKFLQQHILQQRQTSSSSSLDAALAASSSSRRTVFYGPPVCAKCGTRGHADDDCSTPFCKQCKVWGHAEGNCRDACERCGRVHERRDGVCSTFRCQRCQLFGHRISRCPRSLCSSCFCFGHIERHCMAFRTCELCGELGHHQQHCPLMCSRCGYPGHSTADCMMQQCEQCEQFGHTAAECLHDGTAAGLADVNNSDAVYSDDVDDLVEQLWPDRSVADAAARSAAETLLAAGPGHSSAWDMPQEPGMPSEVVASDEWVTEGSKHKQQQRQHAQGSVQGQPQVLTVDKRTVAPSDLLPEHARVFEQSLPPGLLPPAWRSYTGWAALERALGWANHPVPPSELKRRFREAKALAQANTAAASEPGRSSGDSHHDAMNGGSSSWDDHTPQQQSPWDEEGLDSPTWGCSSLPPAAATNAGRSAAAYRDDVGVGGAKWNAALIDLLSREGFSGKAADVKWRFILPVSEDRVGPFTSDQAVSWLLQGKSPKGINRQQAAEAAEQPAAIRMCGIVSSDYNAQRLPGAKFFKPLSQLVPAVAAGLRYAAVTKADIVKGYPAADWNTLSGRSSTSTTAQEPAWLPQQQQQGKHRLARLTSATASAFEVAPTAVTDSSSVSSNVATTQLPCKPVTPRAYAAAPMAQPAAPAPIAANPQVSYVGVHSSAANGLAQSANRGAAGAGALHPWPGAHAAAVLPNAFASTIVMPAAMTTGIANVTSQHSAVVNPTIGGNVMLAGMPVQGHMAGGAVSWSQSIAAPAASPPVALPAAISTAGLIQLPGAEHKHAATGAAAGVPGVPAAWDAAASRHPPELQRVPPPGFQLPHSLPVRATQLPVSLVAGIEMLNYRQQVVQQPTQLQQVPVPPGFSVQQPAWQTAQSAAMGLIVPSQSSSRVANDGNEDVEVDELMGLLGI